MGFFTATTAAIVGVVGAVTAGVGTYMAGQAQQQASEYNAKLADREAQQRQQEAAASIRRMRANHERIIARQRVSTAAAGLEEEGSPLEIMSYNAQALEMEAIDTANAAQFQAASLRDQASLLRFSGRNAATAGAIGGAGSLLGGTSSALSLLK